MDEPTLDDLRGHGVFAVASAGAPPQDVPCALRALRDGVGQKGFERWVLIGSGFASSEPLTVATPTGRLELRPNRPRLHLAPAWPRVVQKADRDLPPMLAQQLADSDGPLTIETDRLVAGRPSHARVDVETALRPPRPGASPRAAPATWGSRSATSLPVPAAPSDRCRPAGSGTRADAGRGPMLRSRAWRSSRSAR